MRFKKLAHVFLIKSLMSFALFCFGVIVTQTYNSITLDINDIALSTLERLVGQRSLIDGVIIVRSTYTKHITPEKIQLLAQAFPHITYLNLSNTGLDGEGIAALQFLLSGAVFARLEHLDISQNPLSELDIYILKNVEMPLNLKLPPLQSLNISGLDIPMILSPATFEGIKNMGYFSQKALQFSLGVYFRNVNLRDFDVSYNPRLGDLPIYALIDSTLAQSLEKLNLAYTHPTAEGLERLASSGSFKRLRSLNLAGNYNFGATQLYKLAAGLGSQLEELILTGTQINTRSEALVRKLFPKLKKLIL